VEIFQNCIVYNDGAFDAFTERSVAADRQILLQQGKPMIFGKDADKGLRLATKGKLALEVVKLGEDGVTEADLLVHDETDRAMAGLLAALQPPQMPVALGVLYCDPAPSYEASVVGEVDAAKRAHPANLAELLHKGHTWTVS
jgi:2-oxoglutarate ferredoxin oxidoreductase subunit beta